MRTIDFDNLILGRASTTVAKALLRGENVNIVNCEKAVVIGTPEGIMEKFRRRNAWRHKGNPAKRGPKFDRAPDRLVRYTIRNMLPDKQSRGKEALLKLRIFIGIPKNLEGQSFERIEKARNTEPKRFMTMAKISQSLGMNMEYA